MVSTRNGSNVVYENDHLKQILSISSIKSWNGFLRKSYWSPRSNAICVTVTPLPVTRSFSLAVLSPIVSRLSPVQPPALPKLNFLLLLRLPSMPNTCAPFLQNLVSLSPVPPRYLKTTSLPSRWLTLRSLRNVHVTSRFNILQSRNGNRIMKSSCGSSLASLITRMTVQNLLDGSFTNDMHGVLLVISRSGTLHLALRESLYIFLLQFTYTFHILFISIYISFRMLLKLSLRLSIFFTRFISFSTFT